MTVGEADRAVTPESVVVDERQLGLHQDAAVDAERHFVQAGADFGEAALSRPV